MKKIADILYKIEILEVVGSTESAVSKVSFDSRDISKNTLFVAVKGLTTDGHNYIDDAVKSGASCIVCELMPQRLTEKVTYVKVKNSAAALAFVAANFYGNPSEKIKLIGITGTNGKTTVATMLHKLFNQFGNKSGLVSTVSYQLGEQEMPSSFTTPDAVKLNQLLSLMIEEGCEYCFMEVSSHAVSQHRVDGLNFSGGIFTNLTQDHLDYHKYFKDYLEAKKHFFDNLPESAFALTNVDDKNGWIMLQNTKAAKYSYSLYAMADFKAKVLDNLVSGLGLEVMGSEAYFKLVGKFNAYNILAVFAAASIMGKTQQETLTVLSGLEPVEGRFEQVRGPNKRTAIIDYAHTPDALENVLKTIKEINHGKRSQIITVFGCGGNRDEGKRPLMGAIASKYSNRIIITTDNPRFEEPNKIIEDIMRGLDNKGMIKALTIPNRREAIKTACAIAQKGDVILVAGKGHEKYQEVNGIKNHFDDRKVVEEFLYTINN